MSIQEHLNKIRSAVYGREVRESIAKGIETAYDDASEKDNANMEVKIARGTHPNLRSRLEEVDNKQQQTTAQLAQTHYEATRLKGLEDLNEEAVQFIHDGTGGPISIKSIPKKGSVNPKTTTFFKLSTNLYNHNAEANLRGFAFSSANQVIYENQDYLLSELIDVEPNTTYSTFPFNTVIYYKENGDYNNAYKFLAVEGDTFTTNSTTHKVRLQVHKTQTGIEKAMFNLGENLLPYEPFYETIPLDYIGINNELNTKITNIIEEKTGGALPHGLPQGELTPTNTVTRVDGSSGSPNVHEITVDEVYSWYESLRVENPSYITKEKIGVDASGVYDMNVYKFIPENVLVNPPFNNQKVPKIILASGIHGRDGMGDPNIAVFTLYWFMKDICERWVENDFFDYLRNHVEIHVIPLANPWGVENLQRKNSRGVDINRNFDTDTWKLTSPDSASYGGPNPFSESESRALRDYILANGGAELVVDFHTVGLNNGGQEKWIYFNMQPTDDLFPVARQHIKRMSTIFKRRNYPLNQSIKEYGYINTDKGGMLQEWVNDVVGIKSTVLEGAPNIHNNEEPFYSEIIMKMNYDNLSNFVIHFLQWLS